MSRNTERLAIFLGGVATGAVCLVLAIGLAVDMLGRAVRKPMTAAAVDSGPALTSDHLAAKVAPVIAQKLVEAKEDVVAHAGGPVSRTAVRLGYPIAVREVPTFTAHGIHAVLDEFGHYSLGDLAKLIESHLAAQRAAGVQAGPDDGRLLRELQDRGP